MMSVAPGFDDQTKPSASFGKKSRRFGAFRQNQERFAGRFDNTCGRHRTKGNLNFPFVTRVGAKDAQGDGRMMSAESNFGRIAKSAFPLHTSTKRQRVNTEIASSSDCGEYRWESH